MVIRRVDPMSCAKVLGLLNAVGGLIAGLMVSTIGLAAGQLAQQGGGGAAPMAGAIGAMFGVGAIVFFPIVYGVIGFLAGVIGGLLYNVIAGLVGGIRLEVDSAPGH